MVEPNNWSKTCSILGRIYESFKVLLLSFLWSIQNLGLPSFFLTKTIAEAYGLLECLIAPKSRFSFKWALTSLNIWGGIVLYLSLNGMGSVKIILCLTRFVLPMSRSCLLKIEAFLLSMFLAFSCKSFDHSSRPVWSNCSNSHSPLSLQSSLSIVFLYSLSFFGVKLRTNFKFVKSFCDPYHVEDPHQGLALKPDEL